MPTAPNPLPGWAGSARHQVAATVETQASARLPLPARTLRDADALVDAGLVPAAARDAVAAVGTRYAVALPPALQALIAAPGDPIHRQFVPDPAELRTAPHERPDPIGDDALSPVRGIVHRYPDRALLKPLLVCPTYCRFCFRREHVGPDGGLLSGAELEAAYAWLRARPAIREVILTGGDPLMLSPRRLGAILAALASIPHVELLRIHTRVPVADPDRVTDALAASLDADAPLWLVLHANHAREITPEARAALRRIQGRGVPVLGQSVLLRGVNDSAEALEALFRAMLAARVKPYYLHQLDPAPGTAHFHVPVEEGRALLRALRGRVTGLAWPTYVLDIPGGHGKVPLGPDYLEPVVPVAAGQTSAAGDGAGPWHVRDPWGGRHELAGHAAGPAAGGAPDAGPATAGSGQAATGDVDPGRTGPGTTGPSDISTGRRGPRSPGAPGAAAHDPAEETNR